MGKFRDLRIFQVYLANTLNLEDTIDLMRQYPEFNDTVHFNIDGIPLEDIKEAGMAVTNKQIKYIKNFSYQKLPIYLQILTKCTIYSTMLIWLNIQYQIM